MGILFEIREWISSGPGAMISTSLAGVAEEREIVIDGILAYVEAI